MAAALVSTLLPGPQRKREDDSRTLRRRRVQGGRQSARPSTNSRSTNVLGDDELSNSSGFDCSITTPTATTTYGGITPSAAPPADLASPSQSAPVAPNERSACKCARALLRATTTGDAVLLLADRRDVDAAASGVIRQRATVALGRPDRIGREPCSGPATSISGHDATDLDRARIRGRLRSAG